MAVSQDELEAAMTMVQAAAEGLGMPQISNDTLVLAGAQVAFANCMSSDLFAAECRLDDIGTAIRPRLRNPKPPPWPGPRRMNPRAVPVEGFTE